MGPSDGFREVVVPASAAHGVLGPQCSGENFVSGFRVVIKSPDKALIEAVNRPQPVKGRPDGVKMLPAFSAETLVHRGSVFGDLPAGFLLAVKNPQGVPVQPVAAGLAQVSFPGGKKLGQALPVLRTACRAANGIDDHLEPGQAQSPESFQGQGDDLRIGVRRSRAEALEINLPELTVSALLGSFISEHGACAPHFDRLGKSSHPVFEIGADHGSRSLGTKGDVPSSLVGEGVHLFFHHVSGVADTP